jgi:hypothetical protein
VRWAHFLRGTDVDALQAETEMVEETSEEVNALDDPEQVFERVQSAKMDVYRAESMKRFVRLSSTIAGTQADNVLSAPTTPLWRILQAIHQREGTGGAHSAAATQLSADAMTGDRLVAVALARQGMADRVRVASALIHDAMLGLSIEHRMDRKSLRIWHFIHHRWVYRLILLTCLAHVALLVVERPTFDDWRTAHPAPELVELAFLLVHVAELTAMYLSTGHHFWEHGHAVARAAAVGIILIDNFISLGTGGATVR